MTKVKTPFFSLGGTGTVGQALTVSRYKGLHVAKQIPSHPDAHSLPQRYQRWRYFDAVQHWLSLSTAAQDAYRTPGSLQGLTAYQYHMSVYLQNPIDQVLWLRLDEQTGALASDFSGKGNHGTIVGALPLPGFIAGARWFDHINDNINCGNDPILDLTDALTITAWVYMDAWGGFERVVSKFESVGPWHGYDIYVDPADLWHLQGRIPGPIANGVSTVPVPHNAWFHMAATYDGANIRLYSNGVPDSVTPFVGAFFPTTVPLRIGMVDPAGQVWGGIIDDARTYNRVLTPSHINAIFHQRGP